MYPKKVADDEYKRNFVQNNASEEMYKREQDAPIQSYNDVVFEIQRERKALTGLAK